VIGGFFACSTNLIRSGDEKVGVINNILKQKSFKKEKFKNT